MYTILGCIRNMTNIRFWLQKLGFAHFSDAVSLYKKTVVFLPKWKFIEKKLELQLYVINLNNIHSV